MITDTLEILVDLQEIDREILQLQTERSAKPATLEAHRQELLAAEKRQDNAKEEQDAFRTRQRQLEGEVQDLETNVQKLSGQLNEVKTNQAYQALQHEIEGEKASKLQIEEKILETLEQIDRCGTVIDEIGVESKRKKESLTEEEQEVAELVEELDEELGELQTRRDEVAKPVTKEHLQFYERLLGKLKGNAMAVVEDQVCTGCYLKVPLNLINHLHVGEDFVTCTSCARILYLR